jgi:hypothetical protein
VYKKVFFVFTIFLFLIFPKKVNALTVDFSNLPSTINIGDEVPITVNLECSGCGDSYFRGVFYESGTNYFGVTQNNVGEWIGTSTDKTKYFFVSKNDVINATWSGQLKMKVEFDDTTWSGPKNYFFKIARYTSSNSGANWTGESSVFINGPTPSPTPTPSASPTNTPKPSPTPTPKPTPTKSATPKSSPSPSSTSEPMNLISDIKINEETPLGMVAGASVEKKFPTVALIFIIFGIAFLGYGGFLLYNTKHDLQDKSN